MFIFAFLTSIFAFTMRSVVLFTDIKKRKTSKSGNLEMLPSRKYYHLNQMDVVIVIILSILSLLLTFSKIS